jgi:hypothetical protein
MLPALVVDFDDVSVELADLAASDAAATHEAEADR